jgi:PilZ domain
MADAAKRREQRARTVLPVRVFGLDRSGKPFTEVAHTLDISRDGARLGGLNCSLAIGDIIGVQRGTDKARFRVAWVGSPNSRCEQQAGVCCIQPERCIWPAEALAIRKADDYVSPAIAAEPKLEEAWTGQERRAHDRHPCNLAAEIQVENSSVKLWARCTDLSSGGCYLETRAPVARGTPLRVQLSNKTVTFNSWGVVRTCHSQLGMGIQFEKLDASSRAILHEMLEAIGGSNWTKPTSPCAATEQLMGSRASEDPELALDLLRLGRIRAATKANLALSTELRTATSHRIEVHELLEASTTLVRTLQKLVNDASHNTSAATSSLPSSVAPATVRE